MNSLWPPARASLDDSLALPCETLGRLEAAQAVDIAKVIEQLKMAAESARNLRALVSSEMPEASWQNREELDALLEEIQKSLEARAYRAIALPSFGPRRRNWRTVVLCTVGHSVLSNESAA